MPKLAKSKIEDLVDLRRSKEYLDYVKKNVNNEFLKIKNKMIKAFKNHPVTIEIAAGPNSSNTSNTLGGSGNLYSYIGFKAGYNPIEPVLRLLQEKTYISSFVFSRDGSFRVFIGNPTPQDIFAVTPLPWAEGRSWAEGIEKGISGLGYYLNTESQFSRSGSGIQVKGKVRSSAFQKTSYITQIITEFEREIQKLSKQSL